MTQSGTALPCVHGVYGFCIFCAPVTPSLPFIQQSSPPMGCICPPGANKDCEAPYCPRKPIKVG